MYTTYFARVKNLSPSMNLVSIARKTPTNFPGREYKDLSPSWDLLSYYKETGDSNGYKEEFNTYLETLDPHKVARDLGEDAVLVCYEGKGKFCHRHLVALWLARAGYMVMEMV